MRRIVFNGRVLAQPLTGVQRYGVETLRALDRALGRQSALLEHTRWQLALPHDARDVPLLEHFEYCLLQFLRGHAWEQLSLASFARGAYLVNPSYSAPWFKRDQLITLHDAAVRTQPESYSLAYRAFHRLSAAVLPGRVDTVMTISRFSAGEVAAHHRLERDAIVVASPGCDHASDPTAAQEQATLQRYGLQSGGYLLAVGSPKPSKNFALLPRALALMKPPPRWPLVVAGRLDSQVHPDGTGASAALRCIGGVDDIELTALYRHAAWFVFPSLYEGFGLPPLEAMAQGCPVLASDAASIPEVCGDAAIYFDPHDPASLAERLEAVAGADAHALRETMRQRGRARAAAYCWDATADVLLGRLVAAGAVAPPVASGATTRLLPTP